MLTLRGNSPATIDEKGRLKLPSIFRSALEKTLKKIYLSPPSINIDCLEDIGDSITELNNKIEQLEKLVSNTGVVYMKGSNLNHNL